jgi:hypothetical protein
MLYIFLHHGFLSIVGSIFENLLHVVVAFLEIWPEFTKDDVKPVSFIINSSLSLVCFNTSNCDNVSAIRLLESSGVKDIKPWSLSDEVGDVLEVIFVEISAKVAGDSSFFWEVEDAVWTLDGEDLLFNLNPELVNDSLIKGVFICVKWIRFKDDQECLRAYLWNEFVMTEALVVAHVAVKSSNISHKTLIVFSTDTSCESSLLNFMEIFFLEESLEDQEKWWCLVAQLMQDHFGTSPRGFRQEVSIILLFVRKMFPCFFVFKVLNW